MKKGILLAVILVITISLISLVVAVEIPLEIDNDLDGYNSSVDCNDSNPLVWQNVLVFIDNDLDNVGSGGLITLCIGNAIPLGYVNSTGTHNDCNDSNPFVWQYIIGYKDLDNDFFGAGNQTQICTGLALPLGYVANNDDCNDNDVLINPNGIDIPNNGIDENCDSFDNIDFDNDGYFRYNLNITLKDCNDLNSNIYPFALEICNNLDDDCDGRVDEEFPDKGNTCYIGIGECRRSGTMVCNEIGDATFCRGVAGRPSPELCDSLDNDCDGEIDEGDVCQEIPGRVEIFSPNLSIYNTKNILINLTTGSIADKITYKDTLLSKPRTVKLCLDCTKYFRNIQFNEGNHNLTFEFLFNDRIITESREFFIDSKKPTISSLKIITKGFTNGSNLSVRYTENNMANVSLIYTIEHATSEIAKNDCPSGKNQVCSFDLNLSEFNGKEIIYNFKVMDIAGNYMDSKNITAIIDTIPPVINNPETLFRVEGNRVYFKIEVDEDNFKDISYIDPVDRYPSWRVLCSKLTLGICEKMQVFKPGDHELSLRINDKAGNYVLVKI